MLNDTRLTEAAGNNKDEQGASIRWDRIACLMREPRRIFDGHNIVEARVASLGLQVEGIGRRNVALRGNLSERL